MFRNKTSAIFSSARTAEGSAEPKLLLLLAVANCDLQPGDVDPELRLAMQWIAASELGLPALHFQMSDDVNAAKVFIFPPLHLLNTVNIQARQIPLCSEEQHVHLF